MRASHAIAQDIVSQWTNWAYENKMSKAVLGMSGGCDSYVAAKLATMVFGKENVVGVLMPNGEQADIADAERACADLGIAYTVYNIKEAYDAFTKAFPNATNKSRINLPPRLRMCALYFVAQSMDGAHVVTTSNASENLVGYCTLWGDSVGDFAPLKDCTKSAVRAIGLTLDLIPELVNKAPADGLTGKTDEEVLETTYKEIDRYITSYVKHYYDVEPKLLKKIKAAYFKRHMLSNIPRARIQYDRLKDIFEETYNKLGDTNEIPSCN